MKTVTSYRCRIAHYNHILDATAKVYTDAVDFMINVCLTEWDGIVCRGGSLLKQSYVESLTHRTAKRPCPKYDFDTASPAFFKFPSYLRRAAISEAIGSVSSYMTRLQDWGHMEPSRRGRKPGPPRAGRTFPCLFHGNMYLEGDSPYTARIKVFIRNTWDWLTVNLRRSDADYIRRYCASRKEGSPTLRKRGKRWYLDFPFEENVMLYDTPAPKRRVLAVDLGINNACVCCAMDPDGTVVGRRFLSLPAENDSLFHALGRLKKAQMHGARRMPRLWAAVNGLNERIAILTAGFIMDAAVFYCAETIVMEALHVHGKKKGPRRQRLHHWKVKHVQEMVIRKAHMCGIHISTVYARNTSCLAFDGSGHVSRGNYTGPHGEVHYNYSICTFPSGKQYHCDLNASYNIGARYFIRELLKPLPETVKQRLEAKVPSAVKRSTCTLSTLISLRAALAAMTAGC